MQIKTAVKCCYFAVEPCIVYTTRQLLPAAKKDVLPAFHQSNIVYQFLCHCDSWVVPLKGYNKGLSSTCRKPFFRSIFLRTEAHWPTLASQSEALKLKLLFLLLDNIFYKTLHAHMNIMITNFPFLPVVVLLFIFPLLKPRTSKHPNQIYANKFLLSFTFSWTSWFHHLVSHLPAVLIFPNASLNSILAMLRIISATLCQSSFPASISLLITSILNLFFTLKSFSFHHFILFTGFGAFLHFVQMIIALTIILCCFATLSLTVTFVSTTSLILHLLTIM